MEKDRIGQAHIFSPSFIIRLLIDAVLFYAMPCFARPAPLFLEKGKKTTKTRTTRGIPPSQTPFAPESIPSNKFQQGLKVPGKATV